MAFSSSTRILLLDQTFESPAESVRKAGTEVLRRITNTRTAAIDPTTRGNSSLTAKESTYLCPTPVAGALPKVNWRAMGAVLLGSSLLGFGAIFVKWSSAGGATPLTIGTYRMLLALPGTYLLARRTGSLGAGVGRFWAILAGIAFFADVWLWHEAMERTSAANATLILGGLCPIWVALFSAVFLGLRYGWRGWIAQGLALAGATMLAGARGARLDNGTGELIAVAASVCYAVFTILLGRSRLTLRAAQSLFWLTASTAVCFVFATLISGDPVRGYDDRAWVSLIGLGLLVHLMAWWLNSWGLGLVDSALGALGLQVQQVGTLILAAWLLGEPLHPLGLAGGLMIVSGVVLNALNLNRTRPPADAKQRQAAPGLRLVPPITLRLNWKARTPTATAVKPRSAQAPRPIPGYGTFGSQPRISLVSPSKQSRSGDAQAETLRRRRSASWPAPIGWTLMGRFGLKNNKRK